MRVALLLIAAAAAAQEGPWRATPVDPKQGATIRLSAPAPAESARLAGRTVRLFSDVSGRTGLMPVPALTDPGEYALEFLGAQGQVLSSMTMTVRDARFPRQNIVLRGSTAELKPSPGEMETVAALRNTVTDQRLWAEPFVPPVSGCMTSPFGVRRLYNGKPSGSYHSGLDQRSPEGTPIRAAAAGVVKVVRMFNIHGGTVGIDHGQGVTSTYLHMSRFATSEGARVSKGDVIGHVGTTGRSTAPHLHWSLAVNGVQVDPSLWVPVRPCAKAGPARGRGTTKRR